MTIGTLLNDQRNRLKCWKPLMYEPWDKSPSVEALFLDLSVQFVILIKIKRE